MGGVINPPWTLVGKLVVYIDLYIYIYIYFFLISIRDYVDI